MEGSLHKQKIDLKKAQDKKSKSDLGRKFLWELRRVTKYWQGHCFQKRGCKCKFRALKISLFLMPNGNPMTNRE